VSHLVDNYGQYLVASMIIADVTSVLWYLYGIITSGPEVSSTERSGYIIYDFFMGTVLYPRLGEVDIKMVAECRWSWLTLMLLTISCAVKQYETLGYITKEMTLMIIAHWLYSNATVKGEHLIPCTWDMFHEKFGWMLNFWNITGVPFLYCFQSLYIFKNQINHQHSLNNYYVGVLYVLLLVGYYVFDTANSQKACFKLPGIKRNTFPQLPWGALEQPIKHISTPKGALLIDGWYSFARKLQYTGDIVMALTWGLVCGFGSSLPYFYAFFFICMISHRQWRDEIRCREKYGKYWEIYTKRVPNIFFPSSSFYVWLFTGKKPKDLD
jgi:delta24(24(1))-sterol reductase